jgi:adenine-specific DNA-methyltransferase
VTPTDEPTLFDVSPVGDSLKSPTSYRTLKKRLAKDQSRMLVEGLNDDVQTQGIKYAGSKRQILPVLLRMVRDLPVKTVFDGFSGTTRVSQAFAKTGYTVIANDRAEWSECFATAYLLNRKPAADYQDLIDHLNNVPPTEGWFTEHYGGNDFDGSAIQPDGSKRLWQRHNTMKLDSIRSEIDNLGLDDTTKSVVLTALIRAMDAVDSTMGHFVSYLKEWSPRSYSAMKLEVPLLWENDNLDHQVLRHDVFDSLDLANGVADLAYYDPPYGSNNEKMPPSRVRYQSYYHVWKTVILNDKPDLFGAAKRRTDTSDVIAGSVFEEFRRSSSGRFVAIESIDRLIQDTACQFVALSYSNGGRATAVELDEVLNSHGSIRQVIEIEHKRNVMSGMRWTNEWLKEDEGKNVEYMFLLEKS